jgi:hypothetical protein
MRTCHGPFAVGRLWTFHLQSGLACSAFYSCEVLDRSHDESTLRISFSRAAPACVEGLACCCAVFPRRISGVPSRIYHHTADRSRAQRRWPTLTTTLCGVAVTAVKSLALHHSHASDAYAITRRFSVCLGRHAPEAFTDAYGDDLLRSRWCYCGVAIAPPQPRHHAMPTFGFSIFLRNRCPEMPLTRMSSSSGGASRRIRDY